MKQILDNGLVAATVTYQEQKPFSDVIYSISRLSEIMQKLAATLRWFTAGGAIRIAHYDVIDDVIIRKL